MRVAVLACAAYAANRALASRPPCSRCGGARRTFYPIEFFGIPIKRFACGPDQPVGCIGWQGIIPAKAAKMAAISTDLMTEDLFKIEEVRWAAVCGCWRGGATCAC